MKSKKKFDPKLIQQFFLDHTEKFVMGLVALLFVYFIYSSYQLDPYRKSPSNLEEVTKKAADQIARGPATRKVEEEMKIPPYDKEIDEFKVPIDASAYPMPSPAFWAPITPPRLRKSPELFAVEQLRAVPGRGAVADANSTHGRRWIVLTGLVPYKKQLAEFRAKFESASTQDPMRDVPQYVGFFVQRAELVPGATTQPEWRFLMFPPLDADSDALAKMGGQIASEPEDPRFFHPKLTAPLPSVIGSTWGNEAVSPPQIPVIERETGPDGLPIADGRGSAPPSRFMGGRGPFAGRPRPQDMMGPPGPRQGPRPQMVNPGTAPGTDADWGVDAGDNTKRGPEQPSLQDEVQIPDYYLMRFVDTDVKPNAQYQYRVFLVLKNPNYRVNAGELEDPKSADMMLLGVATPKPVKTVEGAYKDWPLAPGYAYSPVCISGPVSGDTRVLSGPVTAGRPGQESTAQIRVVIWIEESGLSGNFSKDGQVRGTMAIFPDASIKSPGVPRTTENLNTKTAVIDAQGGEKLDRDRDNPLLSPGMILVIEPSGNLAIHDQSAETKEWDEATKLPDHVPAGGRGPGGRFNQGSGRPPRPAAGGGGILDELDPGRSRRPPGR
jgi:hypothetical protein